MYPFNLPTGFVVVAVSGRVGRVSSLTVHDFLLLDAAAALGEEGQARHRNCNWDFFVARNGRRQDNAASVALRVEDAASVTLGTDAHAAKGHEAGCPHFHAALHVAAAHASLYEVQ